VPILIALAHDLLITSGVYALTEREVTTSTVAALLTIMGYSLYDTIIVFDRIRENIPRMPRATFSQIANRSMSEVLTRSIATSFTVLLPVGALMLFGGETLKDFAFALLVGVASGAYSSIFIATPVLVEWKEREQVYMRRRRVVMEQFGGMVPAFATGALAAEPAAEASAGPRRTTRRTRRTARAGSAPPPGAVPGRPTPPPEPVPPAEPPAARPAAPPPETAPPDDAPAAPDAPAPSRAERLRAKREASRSEPGDGAPPPGDGAPREGNGAPRESRTTSTAGGGSPKPKPKRQRPRKKHGRR
jgi:SecD/SecF fusion protein